MTRLARILPLALAAAIALLALSPACERDDAGAWVSAAAERSARADEALGAGDVATAREALAWIAEEPAPATVAADDHRVVAQDAFYRLAELELAGGDAAAAIGWADRGLALGQAGDVFTANLFIARGRAREAAGQELDAAADYHEALKINDALLQRVLGGPREEP